MKKKLFRNTWTSLVLQVLSLISGMVVPRMIIGTYGSEVNGLINSIGQFLGAITLLELGVGQVIQTSLYKPLKDHDKKQISEILSSGTKFYRRIAMILLFYVIGLMIVYPRLVSIDQSWVYNATLIIVLSISYFVQYYFGQIDRILLSADQRGYIYNVSQIIALLLHVILSVVLIKRGALVHTVKLASSVILLIRPLLVRGYIDRHYTVERNVKYTKEPIEQKWEGAIQNLLAFVLDGTDSIVLTLCSTLSVVSVYSVHNMVVAGIRQLHSSLTAGIQAMIGAMWARQDEKQLQITLNRVELGIHSMVVFLFSCAGILIVPFVRVYTEGLTDAVYIQPIFAVILVGAYAVTSLKTTYNIFILAAGHFRQTRKCHIVATALNIVISVVGVYIWGLIGVAVGTFVAMFYQMVWMARYTTAVLVKRSWMVFVKRMSVDVLTVGVIILCTSWMKMNEVSYAAWMRLALGVAMTGGIVLLAMTVLFYRRETKQLLSSIWHRRSK